jgi:hypothetical protein
MTGKRLALLVAADQFADPRLSALQAPQADINALAELLSDTDIGGFSVERLVNGTSQELRLALNRLTATRRNRSSRACSGSSAGQSSTWAGSRVRAGWRL